MIDQELERLRKRSSELKNRIISDLERRTERLYMQIMLLAKGSEEREKLEAEHDLLSKELRRRSDELIDTGRQMERLELQKKQKR